MSLKDKKFADVYFCGDEDDGHAKKNKWAKTWIPKDEDEEEGDQKWFWFDKNGNLYRTNMDVLATASNAYEYEFKDGVVQSKNKGLVNVTKKKVNSKDYWFDQEGRMLSNFYLVDDEMYYFGGSNDGSMKTGSQAIKDDAGDTYKFYFGTKNSTSENKGVGITGNKSNKLYYKGLLLTADDYKYQIATVDNVHFFIVNKNGSIQKNRVDYKEDNEVLFTTKNLPKDAFVTDSTAWKYSLKDGLTVEDDITTPIDIYDVMPQN